MRAADDIVVPIAALEHHCYCPRQAALIHVDGIWVDNAHTVRGEVGHRRADAPSQRTERNKKVVRAVPLWSETHGLTGRADAVLLSPDGNVEPVEYKIGTRHGLAADVQLCAEALCLEEMLGVQVDHGFVWYSAPRRRLRIDLTHDLRRTTLAMVDELRQTIASSLLPEPVNDRRCSSCQLLDLCQPALSADPGRVTMYMTEVIGCAY